MSRYDAVQYAGIALVALGLVFVYWPLALIVPGVSMVILAQIGGQ